MSVRKHRPEREGTSRAVDSRKGSTETVGAESALELARPIVDISLQRSSRLVAGTVLGGRYRIVHLLGRGGMGEVYRAEDLKLGLTVALKFIAPTLAARRAGISRFLQEVRLARRISHPNVCRVHDLGVLGGRHYLSMEYIDGEDAGRLLDRIGRLPREKAGEIGHQLCEGVAAAHDQGVLHGDLKPANVMVDGRGRAKITDFGLAALAGDATGGRRLGTPGFAAPERLAGGEISEQADLYSLGLVLCQFFAGRPSPGSSGVSGAFSLRDLEPTIEGILLRCLAQDPAARPTSAHEVAAALAKTGARAEAAAWRPEQGREMFGRAHWQLQEKLGEGAVGEVWLARHSKTGEQRVFKFCTRPERLRGLKREVTVFRLLKETLGQRPDINRILDWSFEELPYYLEAEYTEGGSLLDFARRRGGLGRIPLPVRLGLVAQVADALAAAHSVGVLHKDVKPANVLVGEEPDGRIQAQLSDFGLGYVTERQRLVEAGITALGMTRATTDPEAPALAVGTRLYMAPEILEGKPASVQADIYALGVMLYQMAVGDFSRALAPGWEREIEDELLAEDIAAAVDRSAARRLADAQQLAYRLRRLEKRRTERRERRRREREERSARAKLLRARRLLRGAALAALLLALFGGILAFQLQRASREAEARRQMLDFLVDLFALPEAHEQVADRITAREILNRGVEKIDAGSIERPEIRATLRHHLGMAYDKLGLRKDAILQLEASLEARRKLHGGDSLEVTETLTRLAEALNDDYDWKQAETLAREALEIRRRRLGAEHSLVLESKTVLAGAIFYAGRHAEAAELYAEVLAKYQRIQGAETPEMASAERDLGMVYSKMGRLEEAKPLLEASLAKFRRLLGEYNIKVAHALKLLAILKARQGEHEAADALYRQSVELYQRLVGREHPHTVGVIGTHAILLQALGRKQEAETSFLEILEIYRRLAIGEQLSKAIVLERLAVLAGERGAWNESVGRYREAIDVYGSSPSIDAVDMADLKIHLADALGKLGKLAEARLLAREALSVLRQRLAQEDNLLREAELIAGNLQRSVETG